MWYVNFYFNYKILQSFISFILTMWYVNSFLLSITDMILTSFILTMWYVNVENGKRFKLSDFVLY